MIKGLPLIKPATLRSIALLWGALFSLLMGNQVLAHGDHNHSKKASTSGGAFIVLQVTPQGPQIRYLQADGTSKLLYTIPKNDRLFQFEHAPDKPQLLLSYLQKSSGKQGIWTLDYSLQESESTAEKPLKLNPLLVNTVRDNWYFDPLYSYSSNHIYFVSADLDEKTGRASKNLTLMQYDLDSQQQTIIAQNASYPAQSEQGKYLTWITETDSHKAINVLDLNAGKTQSYAVDKNQLNLIFPQVNEHLNALFYFSNPKKNQAKLNTGMSLFKKAFAHTGRKHLDFYGWQVSLKKADLSQAQHTWHVEDIRAFDISSNGKIAAYVNIDGIALLDIAAKKSLLSIKNPNIWKFRWVPELH